MRGDVHVTGIDDEYMSDSGASMVPAVALHVFYSDVPNRCSTTCRFFRRNVWLHRPSVACFILQLDRSHAHLQAYHLRKSEKGLLCHALHFLQRRSWIPPANQHCQQLHLRRQKGVLLQPTASVLQPFIPPSGLIRDDVSPSNQNSIAFELVGQGAPQRVCL